MLCQFRKGLVARALRQRFARGPYGFDTGGVRGALGIEASTVYGTTERSEGCDRGGACRSSADEGLPDP